MQELSPSLWEAIARRCSCPSLMRRLVLGALITDHEQWWAQVARWRTTTTTPSAAQAVRPRICYAYTVGARDVLHGYRRVCTEHGTLVSAEHYRRGVLHGSAVHACSFDSVTGASLHQYKHYRHGLLHGPFTSYSLHTVNDATEKVVFEHGGYSLGRAVGEHRRYHAGTTSLQRRSFFYRPQARVQLIVEPGTDWAQLPVMFAHELAQVIILPPVLAGSYVPDGVTLSLPLLTGRVLVAFLRRIHLSALLVSPDALWHAASPYLRSVTQVYSVNPDERHTTHVMMVFAGMPPGHRQVFAFHADGSLDSIYALKLEQRHGRAFRFGRPDGCLRKIEHFFDNRAYGWAAWFNGQGRVINFCEDVTTAPV